MTTLKTPSEEVLVHVQGLIAKRGNRQILNGIDLTINKGTPYAIIGESGSGKTTLLFCAAGLLPVEKGQIRIRSHSLDAMSPRDRSQVIGMVFQDYQLFPHLTVLENITLAPRLHQKIGHEDKARELLQDLNIADLAERYPHQLSGGQKQRVAIARSLILEPSVLFFDEPSAALDESTTRELAKLLLRLNERIQIVLVSHDRPFVEQCCGRGARMEAGQLVSQGDILEIFK